MPQVVELQDGETFVHDYDSNTLYCVVKQVCEDGADTGILDHVLTRRIAFKQQDKWIAYSTNLEEECNPYSTVHRMQDVHLEPVQQYRAFGSQQPDKGSGK